MCVEAFKKRNNKYAAKQLLQQIRQPADIRTEITTTEDIHYVPDRWYVGLVSLLHLAAAHGWMNIVIDLITKYKCDTNCKDSRGHTPLHYAARNNHLEVVRYFINEQHCDPSDNDHFNACYNGHAYIVQYLLSTGKVNPLARNKWTQSGVVYHHFCILSLGHSVVH